MLEQTKRGSSLSFKLLARFCDPSGGLPSCTLIFLSLPPLSPPHPSYILSGFSVRYRRWVTWLRFWYSETENKKDTPPVGLFRLRPVYRNDATPGRRGEGFLENKGSIIRAWRSNVLLSRVRSDVYSSNGFESFYGPAASGTPRASAFPEWPLLSSVIARITSRMLIQGTKRKKAKLVRHKCGI